MIWKMLLTMDPLGDHVPVSTLKALKSPAVKKQVCSTPNLPKSFDDGACRFINNSGCVSCNMLWKMLP